MCHFTLENLEECLQERNDHGSDNDADGSEGGYASENTEECKEWVDVRLTVQNIGFNDVVGHGNNSDSINS